MRKSQFTRFVAEHRAGSKTDSLAFGNPACQRVDRQGRTTYDFRAGHRFGVVWWRQYPDQRQHRTLAIVEALSSGTVGRLVPGIRPGVIVHVVVRQQGPAGQDEAVDQLLDLINDLKARGRNPAQMPAKFWIDTAEELLLCPMPLELFDLESVVCRA